MAHLCYEVAVAALSRQAVSLVPHPHLAFFARLGRGFSQNKNRSALNRKQYRSSIRYHDRMLVMCRWTAVSSFHSPAVLDQHRPAWSPLLTSLSFQREGLACPRSKN